METIFDESQSRFVIDLACVLVGGVITLAIAWDVNRGGDA